VRRAVEALSCATDEFHVHERELYWLSRLPFGDSKLGGRLEKTVGMPATMRSVTSLRKLAAKCGAAPPR